MNASIFATVAPKFVNLDQPVRSVLGRKQTLASKVRFGWKADIRHLLRARRRISC